MEQGIRTNFGIYFNQARLNAYIVLCHISELLGKEKSQENTLSEMPVLELLDNTDNVKESSDCYDLITKHFSMLDKIICGSSEEKKEAKKEVRAKSYYKIIRLLLKALNQYRNEYCHQHSTNKLKEQEIEELLKYLDRCFDASVRDVKTNPSLKEAQVSHLRRWTVEGTGRNKQTVANKEFRYRFSDAPASINENGLAFLVCMFLERGDVELFLKQFVGFKRSDSPECRATIESYCNYRIKLPKPVISSETDIDGLALDMLNDLSKCPKELFEILSSEQQNEFRVILDSDESEGGDNIDDGNDEIFMRRYQDRFAYFALKYCDEKKVFKDIRFQIDLGKYYFKIYDKITADGRQNQRSIDKQLKTFGRLSEVKQKVKEQWGEKIQSPADRAKGSQEPYKNAATPHYHLVGNQIALVISGDKDLPVLGESGRDSKLANPDAWLSVYDLPVIIFHGIKKGFGQTEDLIRTYVEKQRAACNTLLQGQELSGDLVEYVPRSLLHNGRRDKNQQQYRREKLRRIIEDNKHRQRAILKTIERVADKSNKPGSGKYIDLRAGKLADFLAHDMLDMQGFDPQKNGKDKITSVNFQVLQAALAYFGAKKDVLPDIFGNCYLLGGNNPHPFLGRLKIKEYVGIVSFYKGYLAERLTYLKKLEANNNLDVQFLRPSRGRFDGNAKDDKKIAAKLLENPVNLPGAIFNNELRSLITADIDLPAGIKKNNALLIEKLFKAEGDGPQEFYNYKRHYPVFAKAREYLKKNDSTAIKAALQTIAAGPVSDNIKDDIREFQRVINKNIRVESRFNPPGLDNNLYLGVLNIEKTEKLLRRYRLADMVSFMMVREILKDKLRFTNETSLRLADIGPGQDRLFNQPISCDTVLTVRFNCKDNFNAGYISFLRDKYSGKYRESGNMLELECLVRSENTKLRDLGKYRRYFYDRRLPGLLLWLGLNAEKLQYEQLEAEIKAFAHYRKMIAGIIWQFEGKALELFPELKNERAHYTSFAAITDGLAGRFPQIENQLHTIKNIRNAVYHNQFPACYNVISEDSSKSLAERIHDLTDNYINTIVSTIERQAD